MMINRNQGKRKISGDYEVVTIKLGRLSGNCYLIRKDADYFLIDTGLKSKRNRLLKIITGNGCNPGNLKLIILTHGDFDHSGNGAFLKKMFGCPIAIHFEDSQMIECRDMFINRKSGNRFLKMLIKLVFTIQKFSIDVLFKDNDRLEEFGLNAGIVHLPGHSSGSIGVLTSQGDLFCGDLLTNIKKPMLNAIMDQPDIAKQSMERLSKLEFKWIFPGHGNKFSYANYITIGKQDFIQTLKPGAT
ncbi:MAG: MBL fold metallo-hydrolase [Bacteroidota bacterium]